MEPVSAALLAALAGGVGGELGRQVWAGLSALVRRPFNRNGDEQPPAISSGEAELARLAEEPGDRDRAHALSTALAVRAAVDEEFRSLLVEWHRQAQQVRTEEGAVTNTISGGTQYGPVIQGRDFSGLTFTTPPPPNSSSGAPDDGGADSAR